MHDQAHGHHPERLTRREREVGELLRRGLTNEEIAACLGISLDGAKYHVSQILSKIGVATREEAARALAAPKSRRQWTAWPLALRLLAASLVAVTVVGVTLLAVGVLLTSGSHDTSLAHPTGILQPYQATATDNAGLANSGLTVTDPGSDKIVFPSYLSNISGLPAGTLAPSDIAFDAGGNLWMTWFDASGGIVLARNPAGTTTVSEYSIPSDRTSQVHLRIDGKGRPVVGAGEEVVVVDPSNLAYQTIVLSTPSQTPSPSDPPGVPSAAGQILGVRALGESAFLLRYEMNSITEVSLESGQINDVEVPSSFGTLDDFVVTPDRIWLLKTGDGADGTSQIGSLDRSTGNLTVVYTKVHSAGPHQDGVVALTWNPDGVAFIHSGGVQPIHSEALDTAVVDKIGPESSVHDDGRGGVWLSDVSAKEIVWLDPSTGAADVYALPVWQTFGPIGCPDGGDCTGPATVLTHITATAVSPDGDLYFADATMNRVGEIHRA
jgi:DNA-binding CsgD family transcriptional regulator